MPKANAAEWILRRVVSPARASEIIGDLVEAQPGITDFRFWLIILRLFATFTWRPVLGLFLAPIAGLALSWLPFSYAFTRLGMHGYGAVSFGPRYFLLSSTLLWIVTTFSLVRFGFRSRLTHLSTTAAAMVTVATCIYPLPYAVPAIYTAFTVFLLVSVLSPNSRRSLAILAASFATGSAILYGGELIHLNPRRPMSVWFLLGILLLVTLGECLTLSALNIKLRNFDRSEENDKSAQSSS